jgi:hypothetical protein
LVYVALSAGGAFDFCAAVPVLPLDPAEPVYSIQCIGGVPRRVVTTSNVMVCASGTEPLAMGNDCTDLAITASIMGGPGNGTWSVEFATNYDAAVGITTIPPTIMYRKNGGVWAPIYIGSVPGNPGVMDAVTYGPRHARPMTANLAGFPNAAQCGRYFDVNAATCSPPSYYVFQPTDTIEFALRPILNIGGPVRWQATFFPA